MPPPRKRHGHARLRTPPRRLFIVVFLAIAVFLIIWASSPTSVSVPSVPSVAEISETAKHAANIIARPSLPKLYSPFGDVAHAPPEQADSAEGRTKWYSGGKWLHPFSSETTLDEQRALLPPLRPRTPIYTYYDGSGKETKVLEAEHKLLVTWRRAWWAKGFKPIVLGRPEALKNPLYSALPRLKLDAGLQAEFARWLAWDHMGGGILANWLVFPMAGYDDGTISSLRYGNFATLTMYRNLPNGLFSGGANDVNKAVKTALKSVGLAKAASMVDVLSTAAFDVATTSAGVAFYDMPTISSNYVLVAEELSTSRASGLTLLQQLINAHLHVSWQNSFPDGVAVLQPHPQHTSTLVHFASRLGQDLLKCPDSPMSATCPPNWLSCIPCTSSSSQSQLLTPETFRNRTKQFTIGTVPHPYSFSMLHYSREKLDVAFVRRDTLRDLWLNGTTSDLLGKDISGPQRLVRFKEVVASNFGTAHSLWVTAELEEQLNRDWIFGFEIPSGNGLGRPSGVAPQKGTYVPTSSELAREKMLLELARETLQGETDPATVAMVEAWNLADAEAWRFVRAFAVRRRVEREKWQKEESQYAGSEDTAKKSTNWFEKRP